MWIMSSVAKSATYRFNYELFVLAMEVLAVIKTTQKGGFNLYNHTDKYLALIAKLGINDAAPDGGGAVPNKAVEAILDVISSPDISKQPWAQDIKTLKMSGLPPRLPPKDSPVVVGAKTESQIDSALQVLAIHGLAEQVRVADKGKDLNMTTAAEFCLRWLRDSAYDSAVEKRVKLFREKLAAEKPATKNAKATDPVENAATKPVLRFVADSIENKKAGAAIALLENLTDIGNIHLDNSGGWAIHANILGSTEPAPAVRGNSKGKIKHASAQLLRSIIEAALPLPEVYLEVQEALSKKASPAEKPIINQRERNDIYVSGFTSSAPAQKIAAFLKQTGFASEPSTATPTKGSPWAAKYYDLKPEEFAFMKVIFIMYGNETLRKIQTWANANPEWSNPNNKADYLPQLETLELEMKARGIYEEKKTSQADKPDKVGEGTKRKTHAPALAAATGK